MIALLAVVSIAQAQDGGPRRVRDAGARVDRAPDGGPRRGGAPDAGIRGEVPRDEGVRDGGRAAAGPSDGGTSAAVARDAGPRDAGSGPPAGSSDAGSIDGGVIDGGVIDGGVIDGGVTDGGGGVITDAGVDLDGGVDGIASIAADTSSAVGVSPETDPPSPATVAEGGHVIRTLLGLVALLALAWIGAHPRVQRFEERLGISQVVTSGLPFVVLGLIARAPGVDILTDEVLIALTPLLQFGLGWIGFHTGFQFEGAAMDEVPKGPRASSSC